MADISYRFKVKLPQGVSATRSAQPEQDGETKALKPYLELSGSPVFRVLGVPFGGPISGRDADGEAFHPETEIWLNKGDSVPVTYYHGFGPDDPYSLQEKPVCIGRALYQGADEQGHWFDVRLDMEEPMAMRLLPESATVRASSGAVGHLVRMGDAGLIDVWPVGELALFDVNEWRRPANDFAVVERKRVKPEGDAAEVEAEQLMKVDAQALESAKAAIEEAAEAEMDADTEDVAGIATTITEPITSEDEEMTEPVDVNALAEALRPMIESTVKATVETMLPMETTTKPAGKRSAPAVISSVGEAEEHDAFLHYVRTGEKMKGLRFAKAPLQEGTASEGGVLVPDDFLPRIQEKRDEQSIIRKAISTSGGVVLRTSRDQLTIPREATSMLEFAITAEEALADENEPTFDSLTIPIFKFTKLVKVSEEMLEDDATNLEEFLGNAFGRAWALTENKYGVNGTGTGQPMGVLPAATLALTFASATGITAQEVVALYHKMVEPYAEGAVWTMRNSTLGHLRGLTGNPFQFTSTPAGGQKALYDAPFVITEQMPAIASTAKTMLLGNWQYYALVERKGMSIRRLNELYAANGQVGILATVRFGGAVIRPEAFQYGKQAV